MASARTRLLESIAATIADYRQGEIAPPDAAHVARWINQFEATVRDPLLAELDQVLTRTYITRVEVETFLASLVTNAKLAGDNPCDFWRSANFLSIQGGGNSQREMLKMFDQVLRATCNIGLDQCGASDGPYIYLDDVIFSGNRVKNDLVGWLASGAPAAATVHVVVIAYHRGGQYYASTKIDGACAAAGKTMGISWWRSLEIEDRKRYVNDSDVLRPSSLPEDEATQAYVASLRYPPVIRQGAGVGEHKFFSTDAGRCLLEQEMLQAGLHIRSICPYLNTYQRPLGNMVLDTLGFGSLIVTFRNCPNNAPLAFWAGDPWYPLFPRKTN